MGNGIQLGQRTWKRNYGKKNIEDSSNDFQENGFEGPGVERKKGGVDLLKGVKRRG